ncbi:MAG: hypothetical protein Q9226_005541 [Calogaya cf. arnoldii]
MPLGNPAWAIAHRPETMQQLMAQCTLPRPADIQDHTCNICHENSLAEDGVDTPILLRCNHAFGMACLTKWVFKEMNGTVTPLHWLRCPYCRITILPKEAIQAGRQEEEQRDMEKRLNEEIRRLAGWTPGGGPPSVDERFETWILRAEELWTDLCNAILDDLDDFSDFPNYPIERPTAADGVRSISNFHTKAQVAERVLSFGTVFQFYLVFQYQWERHVSTQVHYYFPERYQALMNHLKTAEKETMAPPVIFFFNDYEWRVRQAYQSPQSQLDVFRSWMEKSRARLGQLVERAVL